jgi:hypothetical protein
MLYLTFNALSLSSITFGSPSRDIVTEFNSLVDYEGQVDTIGLKSLLQSQPNMISHSTWILRGVGFSHKKYPLRRPPGPC